jgi:hypothetical protein
MMEFLRRAWCCILLITMAWSTSLLQAADKGAVRLFVKDALAVPREPVAVEAKLIETRLLSDVGLGGEPLELVVDGKVVAKAMTGGDGRAFLSYTPTALGVAPMRVRVALSPRVSPTDGEANLVVWERRNPILVVELAALIEEFPSPGQLPAIGFTLEAERKPMLDAADELEKLTKFYYRVIYAVTSSAGASDGFQAGAEAREWLRTHKFPTGYVMVLPSVEQALGTKLDELHNAGWKTIKTGIGRTKAFAQAFLQRRLDVVLVPESVKGEIPRKAKVAKGWKDVRKKL